MKKLYTIHEVAKTLGISTDAIRLYEKEGLLTPIRDERNNYRYYDMTLVQCLMGITLYRKLGVSVADTKKMFEAHSFDDIHNNLNEVIDNARQEIAMLESRVAKLNHVQNHLRTLEDNLNNISQVTTDELYVIKRYPLTNSTWDTIQNILSDEYFSFGHIGYFAQFDENLDNPEPSIEFSLSGSIKMLIPEDYLSNALCVEEAHPALYTVMIFNKHSFNDFDLNPIKEYARTHNIKLTGRVHITHSFSLPNGDGTDDYFEIFAEME